jgi:L-aspartate oxidase
MDRETVRDLMWRDAGLFRDRDGLARAVAALDAADAAEYPATADGRRQRNLVTVARLIAQAALRREESRGGHFRADFPARDDERWNVHVVDVRGVV